MAWQVATIIFLLFKLSENLAFDLGKRFATRQKIEGTIRVLLLLLLLLGAEVIDDYNNNNGNRNNNNLLLWRQKRRTASSWSPVTWTDTFLLYYSTTR